MVRLLKSAVVVETIFSLLDIEYSHQGSHVNTHLYVCVYTVQCTLPKITTETRKNCVCGFGAFTLLSQSVCWRGKLLLICIGIWDIYWHTVFHTIEIKLSNELPILRHYCINLLPLFREYRFIKQGLKMYNRSPSYLSLIYLKWNGHRKHQHLCEQSKEKFSAIAFFLC